jgi:endonuclease YncB( thermonuclease family)
MPFTVICGTYHLVNRNVRGRETGFEPDGDSIHFRPTRAELLARLTQIGRPFKLTEIGSLMLRLEGVDALELHYQSPSGGASTHQPRPLADHARDFLTGELGLNPVPYLPPRFVRVQPPVLRDAAAGFILSRTLEINGRPVSFAFAGRSPEPDGAAVNLSVSLLKQSLNYALVRMGHAYPLFYDGLFVDLRNTLAAAAREARGKKRGLWARDRSRAGLEIEMQADLERDGVIFPKLFRRLTEFVAPFGRGLAGFADWLATRNERILDLPTVNFTGFDNLVRVEGNRVQLSRWPEEIVFISAR